MCVCAVTVQFFFSFTTFNVILNFITNTHTHYTTTWLKRAQNKIKFLLVKVSEINACVYMDGFSYTLSSRSCDVPLPSPQCIRTPSQGGRGRESLPYKLKKKSPTQQICNPAENLLQETNQ